MNRSLRRLAPVLAPLAPALLLAAGASGAADAPAPGVVGAAALVARGDAAWARRAEGHVGDRARLEPVQEAIRAYTEAVRADPDALEAHWKAVRALYFAGEFTGRDDDDRRTFFDRATAAAEEAFAALERAARPPGLAEREPADVGAAFAAARHPAVVGVHFWAAVAWGAWSQHHGLLDAVREGVAGRLRRYARVVVALDPAYEHGGAHRILCRLHTTLPRVPFLTGWVERDRALAEIERALELAPDYPGNELLLALTLLELRPARRDEARERLRAVARLEPAPGEVVEQLAMREAARERLEEAFGAEPAE